MAEQNSLEQVDSPSSAPVDLTPSPSADTGYTAEELKDFPPDPAPSPDPAPPAEGDADPAPEPDEAPPGPDKRPVPHGALHKERELRKAAEKSAAEMRAQLELVQRRQEEMRDVLMRQMQAQQGGQPQQPQANAVPDKDLDPVGYLEHQIRTLEARQQEVAAPLQQQQQIERFQSTVRASVDQFAANTPDYGEALAHARSVFQAQAEMWGEPAAGLEIMFADKALRDGKNVGEELYNFAKKAGYKAATERQAPPEVPAGQAPDLSAITRGQAATKSVQGGGVPQSGQQLTAASLANMTAEQIGKLSEEEFVRIMTA